ncbi:MAG: MBL fold metallo-hydrolase [Gammaproteobacteria bacterium]|nr:MBL fold metallo-hydrolase [Gammaproteobacteria bacterium]MBL7000203.1 MBL fold metallo-hydrolase [Gammaproteobacteria bacterium]
MRYINAILFTSFLFSASQVFADLTFPMHPQQVAPDIYALITPTRNLPNPENKGWNSNSAFVVTNSGVLLFDTGSSSAIGESIKKVIAQITDQPVRWIINSHAHGDHWLGNAVFKDTVEAIYATEQVKTKIIEDGQGWVNRFMQMTEGATGQSEILVPKNIIDQRTTIRFGDREGVLFLSGNSHSPGDILMWLEDEKVLISGDVIYSDRMPSTLDADLRQWVLLLGELNALQPKVVIPGHGKVTDIQGVMRLKTLLQSFWDAVKKGYDEGQSDFEMVGDVTAALAQFEPHYPGLEEKVKRDISGVFLQVEAASFQ